MLPDRLSSAASAMFIGCQAEVIRLNQDFQNQGIGVAVKLHSVDFFPRSNSLEAAHPF
jgi:hypothetical protein